MVHLNPEAIQAIEESINKKNPVEIHIEKDNVVLVEITRKVKAKVSTNE